MTDGDVGQAIDVPERRRRASFVDRLARRAADAPLALCVGVDPSPEALHLLEGIPVGTPGRAGRTTRAGAMERFAGLVVESARDHAVAVKPQVAWFEAAGVPGMLALERTVEFARTAGLLVVLDAKRGDVPHTAAAYADAWLGDEAGSGVGADAMTVNATVGIDAVEAMARIAQQRHCALYALVHTSNPGAGDLQSTALRGGEPWWRHLAAQLSTLDETLGGGIVGGVVGATRPELLGQVRHALPTAPLLVPGIGTQGGRTDALDGLLVGADPPTTLVASARSLLPDRRCGTQPFRHAVDRAAHRMAAELAAASGRRGVVR